MTKRKTSKPIAVIPQQPNAQQARQILQQERQERVQKCNDEVMTCLNNANGSMEIYLAYRYNRLVPAVDIMPLSVVPVITEIVKKYKCRLDPMIIIKADRIIPQMDIVAMDE